MHNGFDSQLRRPDEYDDYQRILKKYQALMVSEAETARTLDQQIDLNLRLNHFIETFKHRYPNQYEDIVIEYSQPHNG